MRKEVAGMNYYETDPEFMERFEHFAYDEVVHEEGQQLEEPVRYLAILATLMGCQGKDACDDKRDCVPGGRLSGNRKGTSISGCSESDV